MSNKLFKIFIAEVMKGKTKTWQKFMSPATARGQMAFPKKPTHQEKFGIQFDYKKVVIKDGIEYNLFKMQANLGKIPSSIKHWRDKHSRTDVTMARAYIKTDRTKVEVKAACPLQRRPEHSPSSGGTSCIPSLAFALVTLAAAR